jgi:hypothetical protein
MTGIDLIQTLRGRQVKASIVPVASQPPAPAPPPDGNKHRPTKPGETEEEQAAREAGGLIG